MSLIRRFYTSNQFAVTLDEFCGKTGGRCDAALAGDPPLDGVMKMERPVVIAYQSANGSVRSAIVFSRNKPHHNPEWGWKRGGPRSRNPSETTIRGLVARR
jgi:hypothetical protein